MKKIHLYILILLLLISCNKKDPIEVKQLTSKEMVTILPNLKGDSIPICLPIEFEMTINSSKVGYITWNYYVNNNKNSLNDFFDYHLYDKQNKIKPIHRLTLEEFGLSPDKSIRIILKERSHLISKKEAQELLKKYNINKSLENLKVRDTIKLVAYDKFRIENKEIINGFNKISDSISFKVMRGEEKFFYLDKKIDW
jgi:hypothetical protein